MSYLTKQRTFDTFLNLAKNESTRRNQKSVLGHFEKFCLTQFDRSMETIIEDLILVSKTESQKIEDLFQEYISNGFKETNSARTIRTHYSIITSYLKYRKIPIDKEDLRTVLSFPRISYDELVPMNREIIRKFIDFANTTEKAKLLVQASSGLRNQEVCGLRKRDIQTDTTRWAIHVSAKLGKGSKARITFISNETRRFLKPIIDKLEQDDLIFASSKTSLYHAKQYELKKFDRLREKVGLTEKYDSSNKYKYSTHSFRAFFVTSAEKVHDGFGHALAGHSRYMQQYERYTLEEKLNFYLEIEPSLTIYDNIDSIGKDTRISNLEKQVESMKSYIDELTIRLDTRV
jgi:integrase